MTYPPEPDFGGPRMDADMPDYSDPGGDDFESLSRDRVPLRSAGHLEKPPLCRRFLIH